MSSKSKSLIRKKKIKKKVFPRHVSESLSIDIYEKGKTLHHSIEWSERWEISPSVAQILECLYSHSIEEDMDGSILLENVLNKILDLTSSAIGNIAVLSKFFENGDSSDEEEKNLTCLALGEKVTGTILPQNYTDYQKSIKSFFAKPMKTGRVILTNDFSNIRTSTTIPEGHPTILTFLSIPIFYQKIPMGVLAVANADSYSLKTVKELLPLFKPISSLIKKCLGKRQTLADVVRNASEVDEIKDRFLATVSHELRTPLNGILALVSMLEDAGPLNKKQKEYTRNAMECSIQLTNLLNNILDFSKMAANRLALSKHPLLVENTVMDCVRMFDENIKAKGLYLKLNIQKNIPGVIGDPQRLTQILSNLLSNAYKFTDEGGITIDVVASPVSSPKNKHAKRWKIMFTVSDTGVGIPGEEQDRIFETFHQVSTLDTYNSKSGTGLGLSIARELVRLMEGKISVSSKGITGEGAAFTFYIILSENISVDTMTDDNQLILREKKVLIIDDRSEMRMHLSDIVYRWQCIPHTVTSAAEALQCLRFGMEFDVALVDICMPGMSGIDLAQELRQLYPSLPLIGVSSADVTSGTDYFDHYMCKPVDQTVLFSALIDCLSQKKKKTKSIRKKRKRQRKNLRVLIAEDDSHNIYTLREMLLHLGVRESNIFVAHDGLECVRIVNETEKPFDVILMDIKMPKMDGLEATRIIKKKSSQPLIIAVSAAVQPSEKAKGQRAGIDGYLSKPLLKEKLEKALIPLLKK